MEVLNSVVLKPSSSCCYTTHIGKLVATSKSSCFSNSQVCFRKGNRILSSRGFKLRVGNHGFEDKGHMEYYSGVSPFCGEKKGKKGWNGIPVKKRMKLLKGLVKDLSTFSDLGFGLGLDCDNKDNLDFVADDKSRIISEAAETLLTQLKLLRAEEEQMKNCKSEDCESSSSSSESSDSECDDEVIDMKTVKYKVVVGPIESKNEEQPSTTASILQEQSTREQPSQNLESNCCNMILDLTLNKDAGIQILNPDTVTVNQTKVGKKKIEVCMGGKCKKLGAPALMNEFQRVMGNEGVVEGCKCMGKCKTAPNVRLLNGNDYLKASNPLCIGVGLEDVELIVANHFAGEGVSKDQVRVAAWCNY
ncbi:hypothetical protein SOVF_145620 [Spinacia oleracea]|nr:hypothetical protein SOVF_145620 [Spinacia oleracea]